MVTNQPEMVEAAKRCYENFPTVVNEIPESGLSYDNTLENYAKMDTAMQGSQKAIGGSSDTAQLALAYYFNDIYNGVNDENTKHYYDNFIILAVLAQVAIDGCKRTFAVDANDEIKRIRSMECMKREKDFPKFMKFTHKIPVTKNGKERPYAEISRDKSKVDKRIDNTIVCPMNWMQECLEKIQMVSNTNCDEIKLFMSEKPVKHANDNQMRKIRKIVEDFDSFTKRFLSYNDLANDEDNNAFDLLMSKSEEVYETVSSMKISYQTMYRLIEAAFGYDSGSRKDRKYQLATKYVGKTLNVLYRAKRDLFLSCFIRKDQ